MTKKTLISWSTGKDSAWACYQLKNQPEYDLVGLFCTINKESRLPAPKNRKAALRDGINYEKESRLPAPKNRKAASRDGIVMSARPSGIARFARLTHPGPGGRLRLHYERASICWPLHWAGNKN